MINSRSIDDLLPVVALKCRQFIAACDKEGVDILVTSTLRDREAQAALYAQGRTAPGKIVTNAPAGKSAHQYKVAFDWVPLTNGKPNWSDNALWSRCGQIATSVGLEWGGNWRTFRDMPHCQDLGGKTIDQLFQESKQ